MLRVVRLSQTSPACPAQWEGRTTEDEPVYVRYRFGYLSVRLGPPGGDIDSAVYGPEIFGFQHGEDLDGWMEYEELCQLTAGRLRLPYDAPQVDGELLEHTFATDAKGEDQIFLTMDRGFKADPRVMAMLDRVARGEEKLFELRSFAREHRN